MEYNEPNPRQLGKIGMPNRDSTAMSKSYRHLNARHPNAMRTAQTRRNKTSMMCTLLPSTIGLLVAIIHESLFQISAEPTLGLGCCAAPSFQRFPPRRIHIHPDHNLPLFIVYTDIIVLVIGCSPPTPGRRENEAHHGISDPVAEGGCMCRYGVEREIVCIALVIAAEERDDQEGE